MSIYLFTSTKTNIVNATKSWLLVHVLNIEALIHLHLCVFVKYSKDVSHLRVVQPPLK